MIFEQQIKGLTAIDTIPAPSAQTPKHNNNNNRMSKNKSSISTNNRRSSTAITARDESSRTHINMNDQNTSTRTINYLASSGSGSGGVGDSTTISGLIPRPNKSTAEKTATQKSVVQSKILFFLVLITIAAVAGGLLYTLLRRTEQTFAKDQFQSLAQRALKDCTGVVTRKRLSMESMASMISEEHHNASDWPYVVVRGYERIVEKLSRSGSHTNMGFAPIVHAVGTEQEKWEDFAYDYFDRRISSGEFPNTTGINKFGKGIWRLEKTENNTMMRIHDNDMSRDILTPIIQCCVDNPGDKILLYNLYSERHRRETMEEILECSRRMQEPGMVERYPDEGCFALTEFVRIVRFNQVRASSSIMFAPIKLADGEVVGFILSPMVWDEIFENVFPAVLEGVHCVLKILHNVEGTRALGHEGPEHWAFTFIIRNGRVEQVEASDMHESKYDENAQSANLHESKYDEIAQSASLTHSTVPNLGPAYSLMIYPTDEFIESYSTNNPRNATIAALSVMVLITILFVLYDFFVRREFQERQQVLEAKRTFIRYVSHEVRTPLNAVLMGLNIIQNDEKDSERSSLIKEIQNSANSAVVVLNEVLQYDKIERKTLNLETTIVDIWDLVGTKILEEFKLSAKNSKVKLNVAYNITPGSGSDVERGALSQLYDFHMPAHVKNLRVCGDLPKIIQVLRNLISNALKFTPEDGMVVLYISYEYAVRNMTTDKKVKFKKQSTFEDEIITLKSGEVIQATPSGYFQLAVKDSGVGMTEDQLGKLFGEGVQFDPNVLQEGKGSGLGLFIAKNLVDQHKGSLSASSDGIGKGSVFTLRLPLYQCSVISSLHSKDSNVEVECDGESSANFERKQLHILVVDDVASNRKLLSRLLTRNGHHCCMAENGDEAVKMVQENMLTNGKDNSLYDCVLIDYEMPVLNGPSACQKIREMGCDVFIVGITGNALNDDIQFFKSKGANAVLPKPVNLEVLEDLFVEYGM